MMKLKTILKTAGIIGVLGIALTAAGCGGDSAKGGASGNGEKKVVKVAHTPHYFPYDYVNDKNESDGMEVAVMKEVAKKLPQYDFQFVPTSDDDLLIGVESGKYDIGTKGVWKTPAREKKYIFSSQPIAASVIGITIREDEAATVKNIDDFAREGKKLVPIAPQNAQYQVITDYNKAHPDHPINLEASENFQIADAYSWVLEGRYDGFFDIELSYQKNVLDKDAPYKDYRDKLTYIRYKAIPTYALFNKKDKKLAEDVDKAIGELTAEGKLSELEKQYFGEEVSKLAEEK